MLVNFRDLRSRVSSCISDDCKGKFFLYGEETFFFDLFLTDLNSFAQCQDYNVRTLFGDDVDIDTIIAQSCQVPMFSNKQVVIVRGAQNCVSLNDKRKHEFIRDCVSKVNNNVILVFIYSKDLPTNSVILKMFEKAVVFHSTKLTKSQVAVFIREYCGECGVNIEDAAISLLYDYLGNDLYKVTNTINGFEKQSLITYDLLLKNIEYSKPFSSFDLLDALANNNKTIVRNILGKLNDVNDIFQVVSLLYSFFSKLLIAKTSDKLPTTDFMLMKYRKAEKNYTIEGIKCAMMKLKCIDECFKGIGTSLIPEKYSLKTIIANVVM